jgi:protein-disulfide isomerase
MWISIPSLRTSLVFLAVLMACVVAFILAMLGAAYFAKPSRAVHLRTTEGYDFGFASDEKLPWVGPKVGDRINLTRLKTQEGVTLASMTGNKMVMVVLVDPTCGACKAATDEMHNVQNRIAPIRHRVLPRVCHYAPVFGSICRIHQVPRHSCSGFVMAKAG